MKKKWVFAIFVVIEIVLVILCTYLADQFELSHREFNYAGGGFFLSIFFLFHCKDADKPLKKGGSYYDSMKATFQNYGKLHRYKYWAYGELILATIIGVSCFVVGIVKIFT